MKFYNIKDEYINYLKKYYTPFTSPKEKHRKMKNTKDFRKINQGIFKKDEELNGNDKRIKERCCDLPLLEEISKHYDNP